MDVLKKLLFDPLIGLNNNDIDKIQKVFTNIASKLFNDYGIRCGDSIFRFAEIEFYYYRKENGSDCNLDANWNMETYPRIKKAGELFFHLSGADICFESSHTLDGKDFGMFGGILIRSIFDNNNKVIAGPMTCVNSILNACTMSGRMPYIDKIEHRKCTLKVTTRYGIDSDTKQQEDKALYLCYYNSDLDWTKVSERIAWDKKKGIFKNTTRNYKGRFEK